VSNKEKALRKRFYVNVLWDGRELAVEREVHFEVGYQFLSLFLSVRFYLKGELEAWLERE